MKKFLFTIALIIPILVFGQDYKLFHAGSIKLFSEVPTSSLTIGMAFDSVTYNGIDSVFYNYTDVADDGGDSDSCMFWGGPWCYPQNKARWFGLNIQADLVGRYRFFNYLGDTLHFDFTIPTGDSSQFFQDASQKFYIFNIGADTTSVAGYADSAHFFRIVHTDLTGNIIPSVLHNKVIVIGKQLGLIEFLTVRYFPDLVQWVRLIGNSAPEAGLVRITNEMLYDHQPGDIIQYSDTYYFSGGPPQMNYVNFIRHTFLSRTDTQDSILYSIQQTIFELGASTETIDTLSLKYYRHGILAEIPFDRIDQSTFLLDKRLEIFDYCGWTSYSYSVSPRHLIYCPADNCWGTYDTQGPPPTGIRNYVCGLGLYQESSSVIGPPPSGYSHDYVVIYFKKNGVICGNEAILEVQETPSPLSSLNVYPVPAIDELYIKSDLTGNRRIIISNLQGQIFIEMSLHNSTQGVDIRNLTSGIYFVKLISDNGVAVRKFIKR